jgi:hypothetical protein
MRAKLVILLVLAFFGNFAHAENGITFSRSLPRPWTLLSSQTIPGTNTVSHDSFTDNITVLRDTTNLTTMMISVAPAAAAQTTNNLALEAQNWLHSVLSRFGENLNLEFSRLEIKTENQQTFAEAAFRIQLQDATLFGISRYEIAKTNAIGWVAFGGSADIETNKTVLGIAASIRLRK